MWEAAQPLRLSRKERELLEGFAGAGNRPQKMALRIRIVLRSAEGVANHRLASELGTSRPTVLRWRQRFEQAGVEGLLEDAPRAGRKSGDELKESLRTGLPAGVADFVLNFTPGLIAGLLFGWHWLAVLLGGVTYISSSGVIAKVLHELRRMENPETPLVLSVLVQEDLAMAVYLPFVGVLLRGGGPCKPYP